MKQKLISLSALFVAGSMLMPSIGLAQSSTTTASTSSPQTAQINSITTLLQQIQTLQSQLRALQNQTVTEFNTFLTTLSLGSKGDAVLALQALLAANPDIYPEGLVTGYFGKATEKALKRLQKENGLEQAGRTGPRTRQLLNRLLKITPLAFEDEDADDDDEDDDNATSTDRHRGRGRGKRLCAHIPPGHLIAEGWLKKNDDVRPIVPKCQRLPRGIEEREDDDRGTASTTSATTTPVI